MADAQSMNDMPRAEMREALVAQRNECCNNIARIEKELSDSKRELARVDKLLRQLDIDMLDIAAISNETKETIRRSVMDLDVDVTFTRRKKLLYATFKTTRILSYIELWKICASALKPHYPRTYSTSGSGSEMTFRLNP